MRGLVLRDFDSPMTVEAIEPEPLRARDVRIRVDASGVCHSDLTIATGGMPIPLPVILGHEAAGTVIDVGSDVARVVPGDRVIVTGAECGTCAACLQGRGRECLTSGEAGAAPRGRLADGSPVSGLGGMGMYLDEASIHEAQLLKVDTTLPAAELALIGCAVATGLGAALFTARVTPGSTVAVIGLGGVGMSTVQGARICGASRVFAVDPSSAKRELALALGATDAIDPGAGDVVTQVRDETRGVGVDYSFEVVGRPELMQQAYALARRNGTVVIVGMARATDTVTFPALPLMLEGKRLLGSFMGGSDPQRDYPTIVRLAEFGRLDLASMVSRRITLDEVDRALRSIESLDGVRSVVY
jgi:S-(hydroxymethyl)glutathione dehydrogenase / alcohol dehydrogenase